MGRDAAGRHLIVAVADGLSDSAYSDVGATVAVGMAVSGLRAELDAGVQPDQLDARRLFGDVSQHILAAASHRRADPTEFCTALIAAVVPVRPAADGSRSAWFASLADASAWCREEYDWLQLAGESKGGPDRNELHTFLPFHHDDVATAQRILPPGTTLALLTDGVSDVWTESAGVAAWFARNWAQPPPLESFLLHVGYDAPAQLDDRTAVVVWCDWPEASQ